ncbi:MAG: 50S ribosomal protein L4 [Rickettsiales bacterium]|nr:MAG: 50S ribosomal protein L4 [Rickettsiales bacterium]
MKIKILDLDSLKISEQEIELVAENLEQNHDLISSVVKWQLANRRGFSSARTKSRGELAATTKKPFNQKHRGAARHGSLKGAQFVGGAKAFGPKERNYGYEMPKKAVRKALGLVVKDKIANEKFYVIEGLDKLKISTNDLCKKLEKQAITKPLVSVEGSAENFIKSVRNIKNVKLLKGSLNVYDILNHDFVLVDKNNFETIKEVL